MKRWERLDAFPKFQDNSFTDSSQTGGFVTLVVILLTLYLSLSEIASALHVHHAYEFLVDQTRSQDHALQVNLDLTVNTPCPCMLFKLILVLRADVLDVSGESLAVSTQLKASPVCSHL